MMRLVTLASFLLLAACSGADPADPDPSTGGGGGSAEGGGPGNGGNGGDGGNGGNGGNGAGGSGGDGAGGTGGTDCTALDDEFDDPATLACWTELDVEQGDPSQYTLLDIDGTNAGHLTLEPTHTLGWFGDDDGPYFYKMVSGDFVVETHVTALGADQSGAPSQPYSSAGMIVRDPASSSGDENWLMYNLGYQASFVGTEGKTTEQSMSVLTLLPGTNAGRLRICRLGATFHMFRWLDGESAWTLEHSYDRADLPASLQVGLIGNAYTAPADLHARFDYVRFGTPAGFEACTGALQ